jgi:peptidoglycan hydrolase-like protein with peptidoglycan-binding domain
LFISAIVRRPVIGLTAAGAVFVVAAGAVVAATAAGRPARPAATATATTHMSRRVTTVGPGRVTAARPAHRTAAGPLRVTAVTPAPGTDGANGAGQVRVTFSAPLTPGSPMPRLSPAIPGGWTRQAGTAVFTPATGFGPGTRVTVTVPAGRPGTRGGDGASLTAASSSYQYTTGSYSVLRMQQVLAQLGYLPLTWAADLGGAVPADAGDELAAAYQPPTGIFTWQPGYPATLAALWREGTANLVDTGAIMAFEADNGLAMDGTAGPAFWAALLRAAVEGRDSAHGYTYALAARKSPETLTIWHDGRQVFRSLANTGIPVAPTADGTFPVYERLRYQVMTGTNPDGSHYADPVEYVAYFNGGDAVHYFPRYSYGWPQSLGCVELPLDAAAAVWPYLSYGSLVTVTP